MNESEIKYLELLSKSFPSIPATAAEIVRLQAILELPKTTEHFMSDIHGEYTYFSHILKNASGAIHDKINDSFGDLLGEEEKNSLARLLYYPERELAAAAHSDSWYRVTIHRLVAVCRQATDKYTSRCAPVCRRNMPILSKSSLTPTSTIPTSADILKASSTA